MTIERESKNKVKIFFDEYAISRGFSLRNCQGDYNIHFSCTFSSPFYVHTFVIINFGILFHQHFFNQWYIIYNILINCRWFNNVIKSI